PTTADATVAGAPSGAPLPAGALRDARGTPAIAGRVVARAIRCAARDHAGLADATTRGLRLRACLAARGPAVAFRHRIAESRAVAHAGPRRPHGRGPAPLTDGAAGGRGGGRPPHGGGEQEGNDGEAGTSR